MISPAPTVDERRFTHNMMTSFIQIATLVALVALCVRIIDPFAGIIVWGIILSVAIYPLYLRFTALLGGRPRTSATLITLIGVALLLVPGWFVVESTLGTAQAIHADLEDGDISIPPPNESVRGWPLVGERLYTAWSAASSNIQGTLAEHGPRVRAAAERLLHAAGALLSGLLHFVASVIIAGFFLLFADKGRATSVALCDRISGGQGERLTQLMIATIRSVTNGVLGVAVIQAALAGVGFYLVGLPAAGLFTLVILVLAIVQVPAIIVMLPLIVWVYSFAPAGAATVFAIYAVLVGLSDNVLKPLLLGRGVDLPVLVVLIGAIGGMIQFGVIGLFIGAVILGLGYQVITDWIWNREGLAAPVSAPAAGLPAT
ncbi:MAG TPA: AI-2E family transporter [Woeseiaceae bacterium]|nr:AI-2E family transporter [Woeseiaceae bacterium]